MSSEKIQLTKKQVTFLMEMLEIDDPQVAVEKFAEMMADEFVDPIHICKVVDKIISRMKK